MSQTSKVMGSFLPRIVFIVLLAVGCPATGRDKPEPLAAPLGHWVVATRETKLMVGGKTIATVETGAVLLVKRTQPPWLWADYGEFGWVREGDVVPLKDAEAYFSERIRRNPADRDALLGRGVARLWTVKVRIGIDGCRRDKQAAKLALDDLSAVIRMSPKTAAAYALRAEALHLSDGEAIADIEEAQRLAPENAAYHVLRGILEAWNDDLDPDKLLGCFNRAIELDPTSAEALLNRATFWLELPDANPKLRSSQTATDEECQIRGRHDLDEAIRLAPEHVDAREKRGDLLSSRGEYAAAIRDYDVVIRLDPQGLTDQCIQARLNRGECWSALGDYRKALADYTESIRYEERQQTVRGTGITRGGAQYVLRAELYAACPDPQIRNAQQSIADAEPQCARSTPYNGQALAALAAAYAESGDFFAAVECQEKAIVAVEKERNDFKQDWVQKETSKRLEEYRSRLALYQSHQPYRLPAVVKGASAAGK